MTCPLPMAAPPQTYIARRAKLAARLQRPLVIFAGQARPRKYATNVHPFRASSTYLYFGGPPIEGAAWLIEPGSDGQQGCTLFRSKPGFDDFIWIGSAPSDETLATAAGVDLSALSDPEGLKQQLSGREATTILPPCLPTRERAASLGLLPPTPDEQLAIIELRLIKDEHELTAMRRAAQVGAKAHLAAMRVCKPGVAEAKVAATLQAEFVANRCDPSFTPIVTVHGEVLHLEGYDNMLEAGQLLLVDAGAEEPGGYASDMTRTYPVNARFSTIQRQLYDTVLRAEQQAINACVPGARFRDVHDLAARVICEGLVQADLLRGEPADLAARHAHTLFFVHGLGHLIGLDVHDLEEFGDLAGYASGRTRRPEFGNKFLRLDRDLQPGMTVTIEPGCYFVPAIWENDEFLAPFKDVVNVSAARELVAAGFGGIRIEETIAISDESETSPEVLTHMLPNDADEVLKVVGSLA